MVCRNFQRPRQSVALESRGLGAEYKRVSFAGNLPLDANEDELADLFEENVGGVSFVRCVKDQTTGMGKGFAFVVFKVRYLLTPTKR